MYLYIKVQYPWHVVVVGKVSVEEDPIGQMEDEDHVSGGDDDHDGDDDHGDHVRGGNDEHDGDDEHGDQYQPVSSVADV